MDSIPDFLAGRGVLDGVNFINRGQARKFLHPHPARSSMLSPPPHRPCAHGQHARVLLPNMLQEGWQGLLIMLGDGVGSHAPRRHPVDTHSYSPFGMVSAR